MTSQTQTGEGVARPDIRTKLYWAINDNLVLIGRHLGHLTRSRDQLFTALMLPATLLLLFRFMFGGAIDVGNIATSTTSSPAFWSSASRWSLFPPLRPSNPTCRRAWSTGTARSPWRIPR